MQASNPQGILGLMAQGKAPQQPQQPMPSPDKASPMAGLGSVEERVAAYRGNPAPLQQRYAMSQDLLDLLALQKIKSEKDAAARQMQMQMAQQQAAQGQMPTVAQQREKEVMELTKNELAQQQKEQTPPPQQPMGGITQAPGAATAAQPQAMASGGIVAFADGGLNESGGDSDPAPGTFDMFMPSEETYTSQSEVEVPPELAGTGKLGLAQVLDIKRGKYGRTREEILRAFGVAPTPRPAAVAAPAAPAAPAAAAAAPTVAAQQPSPPPQMAGAGLSMSAENITMPTAPAVARPNLKRPMTMMDTYAREGQREASDLSKLDPAQVGLSEEERIERKRQLTPQQRAVMEGGIAQLRSMYEQQYDPEKMRQDQITRMLLGTRGRDPISALRAGSEAGFAFSDAQRAAQFRDLERLQKAQEGLIGLEREAVKEGITAGQERSKLTSQQKVQGLASLENFYRTERTSEDNALNREVNIFQIDSQARDNALNRAVEIMKAKLQADSNKVAKENLGFERARAIYAEHVQKLADFERKMEKDFKENPAIFALLQKSPDKLTEQEKDKLETAKREKQAAIDKVTKELKPALESARAQMLGVTSGAPSGQLAKDLATYGNTK